VIVIKSDSKAVESSGGNLMGERFELQEIKEREGVLHITIIAFHKIVGSEVRVGANWQSTETFFSRLWRYKDGALQTQNDRLEWAETAECTPETEFVLSAIRAQGYAVPELHVGDIVQEIVTGRQGKIDNIHAEGVLGQEQIPNLWRVFFSDGKSPAMQYFKNKSELRLIKCPHAEGGDGFIPERGIME
jgi:hypothetical protein